MEEFYAMPQFVKLFVADVARSAQWYADALGFRSVFAVPGPKGQTMNHLRRERYQDLLLLPRLNKTSDAERDFIINFTYSGDLQSLADQVKQSGGKVEGPAPTRWNTIEVTAQDPDGFMLTFSQLADAHRTFDEVMGHAAAHKVSAVVCSKIIKEL